MRVVTISGSMKFVKEMMTEARRLAFAGYCVLTPVFPVKDNKKPTKKQLQLLSDEFLKKIELSDVLFVVNKDGYIGESVRSEIGYVESLGKEILYFTDKK